MSVIDCHLDISRHISILSGTRYHPVSEQVVKEEGQMRVVRMRVARLVMAVVVAAGACVVAGVGSASAAPAVAVPAAGGINNTGCRPSAAHPNPVVLLHGLGATYYEDINVLQGWLAARGYCTFASTYGAYDGFPLVGGLRDIGESAAQIAASITTVLKQTGAAKVDIVGHSEGAFQSLYVSKTQGITDQIDKVVAIAPPTHGTSFAGLYNLAYVFGQSERDTVDKALKTLGCPACSQLGTGGSAVATLNDGPVAQPGIDYTVITSKFDELVTPTETSFVREPGVVNQYVQDFCPFDPVGHIGEAYDTNVWNMVANGLESTPNRKFLCLAGSPG
ncbi:esterase/lipase family protein [Pseudonocardia sp. GCM10023141]|uniref:esterase/lipase family protein n=1 Tax=Pseudonocardia sp. GCM10023141 TaxID=3252653 RepID=UPI00360F4765